MRGCVAGNEKSRQKVSKCINWMIHPVNISAAKFTQETKLVVVVVVFVCTSDDK